MWSCGYWEDEKEIDCTNTMLRFPSSVRSSVLPSPSSLSASSSVSLSNSSRNFSSLGSSSPGNLSFLERRRNHFSTMSASSDHHGPSQDSSFRVFPPVSHQSCKWFFVYPVLVRIVLGVREDYVWDNLICSNYTGMILV